MEKQLLTFRDALSPVSPETFFNDYFGRRHLKVEGNPDRFADVFSWADMNSLLKMTSIWSDKSLELSSQGRPLTAQQYCYEGVNRDNNKAMLPDFDRVKEHLNKGGLAHAELYQPTDTGTSVSFPDPRSRLRRTLQPDRLLLLGQRIGLPLALRCHERLRLSHCRYQEVAPL